VLLLALVVHLEVLVASINQVELDVQIEVVKIIFLRVDQIALVVDEVVLCVEDLLVLVMDIER